MKIAAIGDSLTRGQVGYSYLEFLPANFEIANFGLNGDTTAGLLARLDEIMSNNGFQAAERVVLLIGINDIYLSSMHADAMGFGQQTYKAEDSFQNLKAIFQVILAQSKDLLVVGLAAVELANFPLAKIEALNKHLASYCAENRIDFVDIYSANEGVEDKTLDGLHWTAGSAKAIAEVIEKAL